MGQHWVQDCPTQGDPNFDRKRIRPPVGIPMTRLAKSQEGGLMLPDGQTGTLVANEDAFAREILGLPTAAAPGAAEAAQPTNTAAAGAAPVAAAALDVKPANSQPALAGASGGQQPGEGSRPLLLDNKPHEAKLEPDATPSATVHASVSQLALPWLACQPVDAAKPHCRLLVFLQSWPWCISSSVAGT